MLPWEVGFVKWKCCYKCYQERLNLWSAFEKWGNLVEPLRLWLQGLWASDMPAGQVLTSVYRPKASTWPLSNKRPGTFLEEICVFSTSKIQIVHRQCCLVLWKQKYPAYAIIIYSEFICKIRGRKGLCNKENGLIHKGNTEGERAGRGEQAEQHVTREKQ